MPTVQCVNCGFLCKRARWNGEFRAHLGYHEAEKYDRDNPRGTFILVPGESNAQHSGEFGCYRAAANLRDEIASVAGDGGIGETDAARQLSNTAARYVLERHRECAKWIQYEPGLAPMQILQESRIRAVEAERSATEARLAAFERRFNKRLTRTAIYFAVAIGIVQLWVAGMALVPDGGTWFGRVVVSMNHAVARIVAGWFHIIAGWFHR